MYNIVLISYDKQDGYHLWNMSSFVNKLVGLLKVGWWPSGTVVPSFDRED